MKKGIGGGCTLSEDIIEYRVLPLLPAKTLIRLQRVSKRWRALISTDSHFMRLQDAHARSSPALLLFGETPCPVFLSRREQRDPPRSIGFPRIFRQPQFGCRVDDWLPIAACRGILCFAITSRSGAISRLYLGNPVWMDWHPLPRPPNWTPRFSSRRILLAIYDTQCGTIYKLVVPFLKQGGTAGRADAAFLVFSSAERSWGISRQNVSLMLPHSRDLMFELDRNVCVEGIFFWHAGLEVLWFDPRDERGGAIPLPFAVANRPLPFADAGQLPWKIGEWEGKLSFMKLVGRQIHLWSWNQSSWSFTTLLTIETVAKANPDFFASMGLRMNLRSRSAESLETVLNRTDASIIAFGAGFIVLKFNSQGICYDTVTGEAWKLKRAISSDNATRPFAYTNSLLKLTTPSLLQ